MAELNPFREDKVPVSSDGTPYSTSQEDVQKVLSMAGYEDNNTERQQIEREAGVQKVVPTVQATDPNIKFSENVAAQKSVEKPVQSKEEPPKPTQVGEQKIDFSDIFNPDSPPEEKKEEAKQEVQTSYTKDQVDALLSSKEKEIEQRYEEVSKFIKAFQENPYAFYAKHSPYVLEKFDESAYVKSKLNEEFGEDFQIVPSDIGVIGTPSEKFLERKEELKREARGFVQEAKNSIEAQNKQVQEEILSIKKDLQKRFKFEKESDFDESLWKEIEALSPKDVWLRLCEHALIKKRVGGNVQKATKKENQSMPFKVPGVTTTQPPAQSGQGLDVFKGLFPTDRFNSVNELH